jgi:uncharacterized protein (TIGR03437 family)
VRHLKSRLLLYVISVTLTITFAPPGLAQTPTLDAEELAFLKLINDYRAQNGLGTLKASIALTNAAKWMANDVATHNYFAHYDSLNRDPKERMVAFGYAYLTAWGENIAAANPTAAGAFNQWKNSPAHNQNMLNPSFKVIGIGRAYGPASSWGWYWVAKFGGHVDATLNTGNDTANPNAGPLTVVNAANYSAVVARNSLATAFGKSLATGSYAATAQPLPTTLGGTSVTVNGTPAPLVYVSPTQVNFVMPVGLTDGAGSVNVTVNGTTVASGMVEISRTAPALFTARADGKGAPAGHSTFDGANLQLLFNPDGTPRAVGAGADAAPNYLILYGTGFRLRTSLGAVQVTVGGVPAEVQFAGAHPNYTGLDQLNLKLPPSLGGRGNVEVVVTVDGRQANKVTVNVM